MIVKYFHLNRQLYNNTLSFTIIKSIIIGLSVYPTSLHCENNLTIFDTSNRGPTVINTLQTIFVQLKVHFNNYIVHVVHERMIYSWERTVMTRSVITDEKMANDCYGLMMLIVRDGERFDGLTLQWSSGNFRLLRIFMKPNHINTHSHNKLLSLKAVHFIFFI